MAPTVYFGGIKHSDIQYCGALVSTAPSGSTSLLYRVGTKCNTFSQLLQRSSQNSIGFKRDEGNGSQTNN